MAKQHLHDELLPKGKVDRWLTPIRTFLQIEAASGIVLVLCTVAALALANSPWAEAFLALWHQPCQIGVGEWVLRKDLLHVINDGLMAVFFFVVGLEIKREMVAGELRSPRQAALPIFAAVGGMVIPAALFALLGGGLALSPEARRGWAIPMATDIAFVVGVLALFGPRVPFGLKIMLLSLAIVDDLGAVLVIAVAFTEEIVWGALGIAALGLAATYGLNRAGVRSVAVYVFLGAGIWLAVLKSGVHPTVAGVLLGLLTPASAWIGDATLREVLEDLLRRKPPEDAMDGHRAALLQRAGFASREAVSPLVRLEHALHPWVAFAIMPIFALANAGVEVRPAAAADPLAATVGLGLLVGKPLGIIGFSFVAVKLGVAALPAGVSWLMLTAGGCLAGIGFTMAIFLATLSLPESAIEAGKIGIIGGSFISACLGAGLLLWATRGSAKGASATERRGPE